MNTLTQNGMQETYKAKWPCAACDGKPDLDLVDGATLYKDRPDLKGSLFLVCGCGAYAQCRKGDIIPLGRPALPELRKLRTKADEMFRMLRSKKRVDDAYDYVGRYTGLSAKHLASPDLWTEKDCNAIMSVAAKKLSEIGK